jgi:taurine dioxygenase
MEKTTRTEANTPLVPALAPEHVRLVESIGAIIRPLEPIGAEVHGIDLTSETPPPEEVRSALERIMAERGFIVFKNEQQIEVDDFLRASAWWGGRELHSTHGIHPATPGHNPHIFRLSNDSRHGIPGVGPQWHNDGSFNASPFSHSGYHIIRPAENGGGTYFAHQGAAFDVLPAERQAFWRRLTSVNSTSGVLHPAVHQHHITDRESLWLHLGMTGAVIETSPNGEGARLLEANELKRLCYEYRDILDAGLNDGYAIAYEYQENDCIFIDNYAVSHRASPQAHLPPEQQGLRIMHRSTVRGVSNFAPHFDLPQSVDIRGPNPMGEGVWQAGGIGFRWDDHIPMQN